MPGPAEVTARRGRVWSVLVPVAAVLALVAAVALVNRIPNGEADQPSLPDHTPVTVVVGGRPPSTDRAGQSAFDADVAAFHTAYPDITIDARDVTDHNADQARVTANTMEDVFYSWGSDAGATIAAGKASDISAYLTDFPAVESLRPDARSRFQDQAHRTYGLPTTNYWTGLVYNSRLFAQAGLKPPSTWDEVRAEAQKITELGGGSVEGFGASGKDDGGGLHFAMWLTSLGGDVAVRGASTWKAAFNNARGREVLTRLHDMRWVDHSIGSSLHSPIDLDRAMGSGHVGMMLAPPDRLASIVSYGGAWADFGVAAIPGATASLGDAQGYLFRAGLSPRAIRAGLTWLTWEYLNPDRFDTVLRTTKELGRRVGLPTPMIWTGGTADWFRITAARYATVRMANYDHFAAASGVVVKPEPPAAQDVYEALDTVVATVLTNSHADINALLSAAEQRVNGILATH